jgi:glutathione S-transferase
MIVLHQFPPLWGLVNAGPFCLKLEAWLRFADLPYRVEPLTDLATAPKGKGPFIEDSGQQIGDSGLIIEHLRRSRGIDPDSHLTPAQRGVARAAGAMLEDRLYFVALHDRWLEPEHWPIVREGILADMGEAVALMVQREMRTRIDAQGLGKHTPGEIYAIGAADIAALADILGGQDFLFGERPSSIDCTAFAFLHNMLCPWFDGAPRRAVLQHPGLVGYEHRMRRRLFPETLGSREPSP